MNPFSWIFNLSLVKKIGPTLMVLMYTHFISVRTVQSLATAERKFIYSDFRVLGCMLLCAMASYGVEVTSAFPNNRYTRTSCNKSIINFY